MLGLADTARALIDPQDIVWEPFAIRNHWQWTNCLPGGDGKQWIIDVDWNPQDPRTLYLVTDTIRVWKSVDRGNTWFQVAKGLEVIGGSSVVSDPRNPNVVYFGGCGHANPYFSGFYRSLDGGTNWTMAPLGDIGLKPLMMHGGKLTLIDPDSYNSALGRCERVYLGTADGIAYSADGGETWLTNANTRGHQVVDLDFSQVDRSRIYAATHRGLFVLDADSGAFASVNTNLALPPAPLGSNTAEEVYDLTDPIIYTNTGQWAVAVPEAIAGTDVIYAATTNGMWKSMNSGSSFVKLANGLFTNVYWQSYCHVVASPVDPRRLLISPGVWPEHPLPWPNTRPSNFVYRSGPLYTHDGGETWHHPAVIWSHVFSNEFIESPWWSCQAAIAFDPANPDVAVARLDGMAKTFDGGTNWHFSNDGQVGARIMDIWFGASNEMLIGAIDYGFGWSSDWGARFEKKLGCYGMAADVRGESVIGVALGTGLVTNRFPPSKKPYGSDPLYAWSNVLASGEDFTFVRYHPTRSNIVYAARRYATGYTSFDGGATWSNGAALYGDIDPANPDIVYGWNNSANPTLCRSTNNGMTFVDLGAVGSGYPGIVGRMAVNPFSPTNARDVVMGLGRWGVAQYDGATGVLTVRNAEAGLTISTNDGVWTLAFDPVHSNLLWVGMWGRLGHGTGVYLSQDGGTTWTNVNNNLGLFEDIYNIDVSPHDGTVYLSAGGVHTFRICELVPGTRCQPRPLEDTDDDGLPDDWERWRFTNTTFAGGADDSDGDGLLNVDEWRLRMDPGNPDSDGDNMRDGWEASHFGDSSQRPDLDQDLDGYRNGQEQILGSDPADSGSHLGFSGERAAGDVLQWFSAAGRWYDFWYTTNALGGPPVWTPLPGCTNIAGAGGYMKRTNTSLAAEARFYRLSCATNP